LRTIAQRGRDGFYSGAVAEDIVATLHAAGGLHTLDDLAAHRTEIVAPIGTRYRGHDVWECPPNGPGATVLMMLNVLQHFGLDGYPALSVERFHLEAEASRHAYLARERALGDPRHADIGVEELLSADFAAAAAGQIRLDRAS